MEYNRQHGNVEVRNGVLHDPVQVTAQRQVDSEDATLLEIVNRHLDGFHYQKQKNTLDRFGARIHGTAFGEIISRLNLDMAREIQPVVEFVWNIRPGL